MSLYSDCGDRENREAAAEGSGEDIIGNNAYLDSHENKMRGLSLEESDIENEPIVARLEEQTDEGDGVRKKLSALVCVVGKKKVKSKEEIEPYSTSEESWTYSQYVSGVSETEEETVNSNSIAFYMKHSSSQRNTVSETVKVKITESECYNFNYPQRGYLLLVINEKFYNQASRKGAHLDLVKMRSVAKKFGLETLNEGAEIDLTKSETMNWLQKAQDTDHSSCDCFMFMISTHGMEQQNPRKGGLVDHALVCADDQLIFTSTITEMFNDTNCPSLKGKPKIFIIQACRGTSVDHGSDMTISEDKGRLRSAVRDRKAKSDHPTNVHADVSDTKAGKDSWAKDIPRDTDTPCLNCDADMLIMYAIPPGMLAWRNTVDGSWMIHYLHEILMAYDLNTPKSFLNVLTKVSAKMARRTTDSPSVPEMHEKKAIPVIEHMLSHDILFSLKL